MNIRLLSAVEHANYIEKTKRSVVDELGIAPDSVASKACSHRLYLGLYDARCPAGLFEAEFCDQVFRDVAGSPLFHLPGLAKHCKLSELANLRTIYVDPNLRRKSAAYSFLYLAMAIVLHRLGARFAIATTATRNTELISLYRKTGGRHLAQYSSTTDSQDAQAVIAFSVSQTLKTPWIERVARCLEVDDSQLRAIRRCRAFDLV